ncbi:hypothetical protein D3C72_2151720 [compost metagenome]
MVPHRFGKLVAIHLWHVAVDDHHVEVALVPGAEAAETVFGTGMFQSQEVQLLGDQQQVGRMVIDDQHSQRRQHGIGERRRRGRLGGFGQQGQRHADAHAGALAEHAVQGQVATH